MEVFVIFSFLKAVRGKSEQIYIFFKKKAREGIFLIFF